MDLQLKFEELLQKYEVEVIEFKEAKVQFDFGKLGKYFSALSNEANLRGIDSAWIVFGVEDENHRLVGTSWLPGLKQQQEIKKLIADQANDGMTFIGINELIVDGFRILMFEIPAAPRGIPTSFKGHFYGRNGESLTALSVEKTERIRRQSNLKDWSQGIVPEATLDALDPDAISIARNRYKKKFKHLESEIDTWDDLTFLKKTKLVLPSGQITRATIILLGRSESECYLSPGVSKIAWILKDRRGEPKDYLIVTCPMLFGVDKIYEKIRNLKYRYLKPGTLEQEEIDTYDPYLIREAIHNCIAHSDYERAGRINVVEYEDCLVFSNLGSFIPGSVKTVIQMNAPSEYYRNRFLVEAMVNLNMVDTIGRGICKMFESQRVRAFPMPQYNLTAERTELVITGKVLNQDYARLLASNEDLTLLEVYYLDKLQKGQPLTPDEMEILKERHLVEGRKPNYYLSKTVAEQIDQKPEYSKLASFDKQYYLDLIVKALTEHGRLSRQEINRLLMDKLSTALSEAQKLKKITNLLNELKNAGKISSVGRSSKSFWTLKLEES